ncbi:MAG: MFS transporter, partial [Mycobacterium sp.]
AALFLVGFTPWATSDSVPDGDDDYDDDDAYVEFILLREPSPPPAPASEKKRDPRPPERVVHPRSAPARHGDPVVSSRRSVLDHPVPQARPLGFAHNGSRVDTGRRLRPITDRPSGRHHNGSARRHLADGEASRGQHHRRDPDQDSKEDPTGYGRHSSGR